MKAQVNFGQSDIKTIRAFFEDLNNKSKRTNSISTMVARWHEFTHSVDRGYDSSYYEYTNELTIRDILSRLCDVLTQEGCAQLLTLLKSADDKLLMATRRSESSILPNRIGAQWWWHRIPLKLGRELANDLKSEGLL